MRAICFPPSETHREFSACVCVSLYLRLFVNSGEAVLSCFAVLNGGEVVAIAQFCFYDKMLLPDKIQYLFDNTGSRSLQDKIFLPDKRQM